ncbi:Uma2 family endonuclease [Mucilaginibacter gracilis]|uniref:Uma2 family endonuclease n=1 Tax=Mucilaginibacter gracilis TaxID=423350 RepID=A0A495J0U9_9SPHI|nr:Uma2 family endonuclease [Mucilaginibacter gracilis]RKR81934.1 Uma2 family endonuclease [Mucilaginibacter gracilis]
MLTTEKKKKYTIEDYLLLEEGAPFQLIENDLIMSPSPNSLHQALVLRIAQLMLNFLDQNDINGYVGGTVDVVFDENNVFQPDVVYVSPERKEEIVKLKIEGVPDLVIEILSPSNAYYDLRQKKDAYQKYGVKEYIIIDPLEMSAELYALENNEYKLHQKAFKTELLHSIIIAGLNFDLTKLFRL